MLIFQPSNTQISQILVEFGCLLVSSHVDMFQTFTGKCGNVDVVAKSEILEIFIWWFNFSCKFSSFHRWRSEKWKYFAVFLPFLAFHFPVLQTFFSEFFDFPYFYHIFNSEFSPENFNPSKISFIDDYWSNRRENCIFLISFLATFSTSVIK